MTLALVVQILVISFDPSAAIGWVGKVLLYLLILGLLITFHELGHMVAAKRSGVTVSEFAFGFGPRVLGFERGGTLYSVNLLPIGGFCKMVGEDTADDGSADPGNFQHKSLLTRFLIIFAGPAFNFVLAAILFAILGTVVGDQVVTNVVDYVKPGTPAAAAHLQPGDEIRTLDGQGFRSGDEVVNYIHARPNTTIAVGLLRNGKIIQLRIKTASMPGPDGKPIGMFGFLPKTTSTPVGFARGLLWGVEMVPRTLALQWTGIMQMIATHNASDLHGPVGIARIVGEVATTGWANVVSIAAQLSVVLGMFNLLPIPALDGGRIAFFVVELLRGRRVDPEKEGLVHLTGFALILVLLAFVTYHDIAQWVSGKGPI